MRILVDTHALIWHFESNALLSPSARAVIDTPLNTLFISTASIWELSIKVSLGKLRLTSPIHEMLDGYMMRGATLLYITPKHAMGVQTLPWRHRDPFDRMLVAQAMHEDLILLTKDEKIRQYGVRNVW